MVGLSIIFALVFTASLAATNAAGGGGLEEVVVALPQGKLVGVKLFTTESYKPYLAFSNIPYAKPPLGNLRFKVCRRFRAMERWFRNFHYRLFTLASARSSAMERNSSCQVDANVLPMGSCFQHVDVFRPRGLPVRERLHARGKVAIVILRVIRMLGYKNGNISCIASIVE